MYEDFYWYSVLHNRMITQFPFRYNRIFLSFFLATSSDGFKISSTRWCCYGFTVKQFKFEAGHNKIFCTKTFLFGWRHWFRLEPSTSTPSPMTITSIYIRLLIHENDFSFTFIVLRQTWKANKKFFVFLFKIFTLELELYIFTSPSCIQLHRSFIMFQLMVCYQLRKKKWTRKKNDGLRIDWSCT